MERRWFQWIIGDQKGQVLIFDEIQEEDGITYVAFKDGSRININLIAEINAKDLTGMYMAEVESMDNLWTFRDEWVGREEEKWEQNADGDTVCVVPFTPGRKVTKIIPPRPTHRRSASFGLPEFQHTPPPPPQPVIEDKIDRTDPVYILMSKSKKNDSEINMGMTISLPPKSLYELARESFDEGDEKFIQYIVDEITVDEIKDALKIAIKDMYETITIDTMHPGRGGMITG